MVYWSGSENESGSESGFGLDPSVPELDSLYTVRNQIVPQELQDAETSEIIMNEIVELVNEPCGSSDKKISTP